MSIAKRSKQGKNESGQKIEKEHLLKRAPNDIFEHMISHLYLPDLVNVITDKSTREKVTNYIHHMAETEDEKGHSLFYNVLLRDDLDIQGLSKLMSLLTDHTMQKPMHDYLAYLQKTNTQGRIRSLLFQKIYNSNATMNELKRLESFNIPIIVMTLLMSDIQNYLMLKRNEGANPMDDHILVTPFEVTDPTGNRLYGKSVCFLEPTRLDFAPGAPSNYVSSVDHLFQYASDKARGKGDNRVVIKCPIENMRQFRNDIFRIFYQHKFVLSTIIGEEKNMDSEDEESDTEMERVPKLKHKGFVKGRYNPEKDEDLQEMSSVYLVREFKI